MEGREVLGRYTLLQAPGVFPLGGDSLALANFATVRRGWRVCDLGCGGGALGLLLLQREETLDLTAVELDGPSAALARRNFCENGVEARVLEGDLRDSALVERGGFDLVISNPPWFPPDRGKSGGPARGEETCTLKQLCAAGTRLLKHGGRFALVHRPERLGEVFSALGGLGLEPKRLRTVHHGPGSRASAVLVEAVKGGRPGGLEMLPPHFTGQPATGL